MTAPSNHARPIAVDAMGGDHAPDTIVRGALQAALDGVPVMLFGDKPRIESIIGDRATRANVEVRHASQAVPMGASPLAGLRDHPDASISAALKALSEGRASAVISFGNSGATVVDAVRTLRLLPGVDRPALGVELPTLSGGGLFLLDVGGNVDVRPEHLVGFASLGVAWARCEGVVAPRVGVLSNGSEASKGNQLTRQALDSLAEAGIDAQPIEPGPALRGQREVVVCDGFVGNVLIKGMEAAIDLVLAGANHAAARSARPTAARLLGVDGIVLVGHGASDAETVARSLRAVSNLGGPAWVERFAANLADESPRS